ncbi:MAG TPA: mechanosensitive ion channel family protein [Actinomycetota bacterium]
MVTELLAQAERFSAEWVRDVAFGTAIAIGLAAAVTIATKMWSRRARRKADAVEDDRHEGHVLRRRATVIGLIAGTVQIVAWTTVLLVLMAEMGVPLGPLFASAGIAGVALGFGAQTVVRDTLAGLFIALEGQFDVGDVLELQTEGGPVSGTVEGLTLRVTIVRQFDGTLSTIPNGNIQVTSNKTRGWGRAIVDVRVALTEDPEKVREVLESLFATMKEEEPMKGWLREPPTVLGVIQLTDTAEVIRAVAETLPNHRLDVERTLRARASAAITESGIRVPPAAGVAPAVSGSEVGL